MRTGAAVRVRAARVPRADPLHRIPIAIHTTRAWIQRRDAIILFPKIKRYLVTSCTARGLVHQNITVR